MPDVTQKPGFLKQAQDFACKGMSLATPVDQLPPGKFPFLQNVRVNKYGRLDSRNGYRPVFSSPQTGGPCHSIRKLNDDLPGALFAEAILAGVGPNLYANGVLIDAGYSGDPLSLTPYRPERSVESWMYISDRLRMRKVRSDGTDFAWGIAAPLNAPAVVLAPPMVQIIEDCNATTNFTVGGTSGALVVGARFGAGAIPFASDNGPGTTGWASIINIPTTIGQGTELTLGTEQVVVQQVLPAPHASTVKSAVNEGANIWTISAQILSAGTLKALDRIHPSDLFIDREDDDFPRGFNGRGARLRNSLRNRSAMMAQLRKEHAKGIEQAWIASGYVAGAWITIRQGVTFISDGRILSVHHGPDGTGSIRFITNTANPNPATIPAGCSISGLSSARVYCTAVHVNPSPLSAGHVSSTIGAGTGFITLNQAANLAQVTALGDTRPVQPDDEIHVSIFIGGAHNLVEGKILFDIGNGDFQTAVFYAPFRPSDLHLVTTSQVTQTTAKQQILQRDVLDYAPRTPHETDLAFRGERTPPRGPIVINPPVARQPAKQLHAGNNQWHEFKVKVKDLQRAGGIPWATLSNVLGIRFQFTVTAPTVVAVDSIWIGGTFGPDVGDIGMPYLYRFRYRSSTTGAKSQWSPPTRGGIIVHRHALQVFTGAIPDPQADKCDIARFGGSLPHWTIIGSTDGFNFFLDAQADADIAALELASFDDFQPFPTLDAPRTGHCNVSGTVVQWANGDLFNPALWQGSEILINGVLFNVYSQPSADGKTVHLVQNAGTQVNVPFEIPQGTLVGQPLPATWGPSADTNYIFGCGDVYQPGVLFFTKGNTADSASDVNQIELAPPTEPLMNGGFFDSIAFVASSERWWKLYPSFQVAYQGSAVYTGSSDFPWHDVQTPVGVGLYSRWFICIGRKGIYFGGKDGIYRTELGPAQSITMADMFPLFPHDGVPGVPVTIGPVTVQPPDYTNTNALRLSAADGNIYFDFVDVQGNQATLVFDERLDAWVSYDVSTPKTIVHYAEEGRGKHHTYAGGDDGNVYAIGGYQDVALGATPSPIAGKVFLPSFNAGEQRAEKRWKELFLRFDATGAAAGVFGNLWTESYQKVPQAYGPLLNPAGGIQPYVVDINAGDGLEAANIAALLAWSESVPVLLHSWQWTFAERPESTFLRITDPDDLGYAGSKFIQGVILEADTGDIPLQVKILDELNAVRAVLSVVHPRQTEKPYSFPPFICHSARLAPQDAAKSWKLFKARWIFEPAPESTTLWKSQPTTHDLRGFQHVRDAYISLLSTVPVTLTLSADGVAKNYIIPSTGGVQKKVYLPLTPTKGKLWEYLLSVQPTVPTVLVDPNGNPLQLTCDDNGELDTIPSFSPPTPTVITDLATGQNFTLVGIDAAGEIFTAPTANPATLGVVLASTPSGVLYALTIVNEELITTTDTFGFRLFQKDSEIRVKEWGAKGEYEIRQPFGDLTRMDGARI